MNRLYLENIEKVIVEMQSFKSYLNFFKLIQFYKKIL